MKHILNIILVPLILYLLPAVSDAADQHNMYAVIVANNQSLDEDMLPLRFADDDGAKYFELFEAAGAETALLTVLDPDAQRRFPAAQRAAIPPKKDAVMGAVAGMFEKIAADRARGVRADFFFIYSGHGNVGANREGYLNFLDARFTRSELYRSILAKSPATANHVILDACHAYFMVNKRGGADKRGDYKDAVRAFLAEEALRSYPNTGVILAASSESETHEWSLWESGIFSHELRSALLGPGDVDGDGSITYHEVAAAVEAANAAIDIPKARLKVYYQPPASDVSAPLMTLSRFGSVQKLVMPEAMAGRYFIEDGRGIRVADFNYSREQAITIALAGEGPFYLRNEATEAGIEGKKETVLASALSFAKRSDASRGSVERSFRRNLYMTPFGLGFYRGTLAVRETDHYTPSGGEEARVDAAVEKKGLRVLGFTLLGAGLAAGIGSGIAYGMSRASYDAYNDSTSETDASEYQRDTENRLLTSRILLGAGVAMAVSGSLVLLIDRKKRKQRLVAAPVVKARSNQLIFGIDGRF